MRMRLLGSTQSITLFAPLEVHFSICDAVGKPQHTRPTVEDVIYWLLDQTLRSNLQLQTLYTAQGANFVRRTNSLWERPNFLKNAEERKTVLRILRQNEASTLLELYGPHRTDKHGIGSASTKFPILASYLKELKGLKSLGGDADAIVHSALEEVEQEREVEFQVEQVTEVQRPPRVEALTFTGLHKSIWTFVQTGIIPPGHFDHVFSAIAMTTLGGKFEVQPSGSSLFVSREFMRTIESKTTNDSFLVSTAINHITTCRC